MKKLEDIPKNNVFEVPDGYFERLPGVIQARVAVVRPEPAWLPWLSNGLKYAMPVLAIIAAAFFFRNNGTPTTEELIASVDSVDLVAYLGDTDISSDDLLENLSLDNEEADAIQKNSMNEIIVSDTAMDSLTNEFGAEYF